MNRILVTGAGGQLGTALSRHAWPEGWEIKGFDLDLDITDREAVARRVAGGGWRAVVNAAAFTAVDLAEDDIVAAWRANALGPAHLAAACRDAAIPLVQISTDYVFSGARSGAWDTDDPPAPLGVYGASKRGGELAVTTSGCRHAIVRTSWLVSAHGNNFLKTMLRLAGERDSVRVVADQRGSPTAAADLAAAIATIAVALADDPNRASGIWHFANAGAATWREFAQAVMVGSAARGGPSIPVEPIATADYLTRARRPRNAVLDTAAIGRDFGIRPRPWRAALDDILDDLIGRRL